MKNFLAVSGKFSLFAAFVLATCIHSFAQVGLRNAMDMDGDGKADYTIFRPSNNFWYILKSGGGIAQQPFGVANEDFIAPGDYDGDGGFCLKVRVFDGLSCI